MIKRVFSGIQPSGNLHIGNYLGAIKNWADSQGEYDNIFCIVDLHAITVPQDPKILREKISEATGLLLACGIDPEKSFIFVQSHIPAHTELAWIMNCFIPMGWMEKMTQFKDKSGDQKERVSVGLFDYPALMAADILLYDTDLVPVGEDQKQHVELARNAAKRFNSIYGPPAGEAGDIFKLPKVKLSESGARIMGLNDPTKKMSKSDKENKSNSIYLLDSPDDIQSKIMGATTDSYNEIAFDKDRPGIYNLLIIYEMFSSLSRGDIETKFEGKGYADFKKDLAELVIEKLKPIQDKYNSLDKSEIEKILKTGAEKVRPLAEKKLAEVKSKIGLG